jgi:hypothetical protein
MARVITFSRTFPTYHPKAGQPTFFVEKCWKSFYENGVISTSKISELSSGLTFPGRLFVDEVKPFIKNFEPKNHTIRAGNRWKAGDKFSPRVWSGKPYNSKQIIIAPDIEIKKVWKIEINCRGGASWFEIDINGKLFGQLHHDYDIDKNRIGIGKLASNDGLTIEDFEEWFQYSLTITKPFKGQIICWVDHIEY